MTRLADWIATLRSLFVLAFAVSRSLDGAVLALGTDPSCTRWTPGGFPSAPGAAVAVGSDPHASRAPRPVPAGGRPGGGR